MICKLYCSVLQSLLFLKVSMDINPYKVKCIFGYFTKISNFGNI